MNISFLLVYFSTIGLAVGVLSMLFGIGGGLLIVPATFLALTYNGLPADIAMKMAVATSLFTIFASSLNILYKQHKAGFVLWPHVKTILPFLLIGSLFGFYLAHHFSGNILRWLFTFFLIVIIIRSLLNKNFTNTHQLTDFTQPSRVSFGCVGVIVGTLSILLGVGGNVILIPYLRHFKMPMKNATAFTVALMPILALVGSIGYLKMGLSISGLPKYSLGYIYLPAFILIQFGAFIGAELGKQLLARIDDRFQAKAYNGMLIIIAILMII
jgi:uncharacterized membrane protein YfcA